MRHEPALRTRDQILKTQVAVALSSLHKKYRISSPSLAEITEQNDLGSAELRSVLKALNSLKTHLNITFEDDSSARRWLNNPNPYLHPATPAGLLEKGEIKKVENALEALASGVFV